MGLTLAEPPTKTRQTKPTYSQQCRLQNNVITLPRRPRLPPTSTAPPRAPMTQEPGGPGSQEDAEPTLTATQRMIASWQKLGYFLPDEQGPSSGIELKYRYTPPASDWGGILAACTVIGTWAALYCHALFQIKLPSLGADDYLEPHSSWLHILTVFFSLEFLYTGLFITCHDAMHGTIAMRNRPLNDLLGRLAISLYAWFDYDMLHRKHWEHHNHTGKVGSDPDFHTGNPALLPWFFRFMCEYMSLWQFVKIAWWANAMQWLGCPQENLLLYMTAAPLLSAFRLFYYGTYVPHHPDPGPASGQVEMSWQKSRTSVAPAWVSFLTCYHFDLHWEHHRWPYAPWWQLPRCRELSGRAPAAPPAPPPAPPQVATSSTSQ